jgi:hypothetical protein
MVKVISNGEKLVLRLSHTTSVASSYAEIPLEKININMKKIKSERDMSIIEDTYEIEPLSKDASIKIVIKDDNPTDLSYHFDYIIFRYNGQKWEIEDKPNPNYH